MEALQPAQPGTVTGLDSISVTPSAETQTIKTDNGDVLHITESHRARAQILFDFLRKKYTNPDEKIVIAVGGPSGSGKSEIGALIAAHYIKAGIGAILVPGDNYPQRAPKYNDAYRKELFANEGAERLAAYLGSEEEILFSRLGQIATDFRSGVESVSLRKINMETAEIQEHLPCPVNDAQVLVFEGTWTCKIPHLTESAFLATDFTKTLEHRKKRDRAEFKDDENRKFIESYVLPAEQKTLDHIRNNLATLWLSYDEKEGAKLEVNNSQ